MSGARVGILYFSGTGGTALVAELLSELLSARLGNAVASIEDPRAKAVAEDADFLVLLYPTYYLRPAPSMAEFARSLGPFDPPKAAYVVTTCELYTENSVRRLALELRPRGVRVAGTKVVRATGSDVTLAVPSGLVPWWYRFERGLPGKLRGIADEVAAAAAAGAGEAHERIPGLKWYTPLAQLIQILFLNRFDAFRARVRVLPDRCSGCGSCAAMCARGAWSMGPGLPVHDPERCELCGRCIHRCPRGAIVLLRALKDNRRLDGALYARLGAEAREALGLRAAGRAGARGAAAGGARRG
jgi:ferredoxin/flavodoxin